MKNGPRASKMRAGHSLSDVGVQFGHDSTGRTVGQPNPPLRRDTARTLERQLARRTLLGERNGHCGRNRLVPIILPDDERAAGPVIRTAESPLPLNDPSPAARPRAFCKADAQPSLTGWRYRTDAGCRLAAGL